MRIATSTLFNSMVNQIQNLDSAQNTLQSQLSTGLSFSQPADNPSAMTDVLTLANQSSETGQYAANANTALQLAQASYSGLTQINDLSNTVDQVATEANNGTISTSQLQAYGTQINQYLEEAVQLGNTQFEGNYIYAGTANNAAAFSVTRDAAGDISAVTYNGNSSQAAIAVSSSSSVTPTTSGATNQAMASFMNQLVSLRDALTSGNTTGIAAAQTALTSTSDTLVSAAAENSAVQSTIVSEQAQATSLQQNLGTIISSDSSADVATTDTKLVEAQTAYQAVLQSSARIMQTTLLNYLTTSS